MSQPVKKRLAALFAATLFGTSPGGAFAGEFSVSPIRADFERGARSTSLTVTNDHATDALTLQAAPMIWSQDADGTDVYATTDEINFFPRIATVTPQNSRVFRLGIKGDAPDVEKAYRFFIEEVPKPVADAKRTQIAINVRFGAPVFVHAAQPRMGGEITSVAINGDTLEVGLRNTGNTHFMVEDLQANLGTGDPVSNHGWYLLPGAARVQKVKLPAGTCDKTDPAKVSVKIVTERPEFSFESGAVSVTRNCARAAG